jgi:hypothetical protein
MRIAIIRILKRKTNILLLSAGLLAACAQAATPRAVVSPTSTQIPEKQATVSGGATSNVVAAATDRPPAEATDNRTDEATVTATPTPIESPDSRFDDFVFQQLLPFDGIRPIYEPQFVNAEESPLFEEELVMGVAIQGEAKAYPVTVLRFREMVDDELGGLPILVTW